MHAKMILYFTKSIKKLLFILHIWSLIQDFPDGGDTSITKPCPSDSGNGRENVSRSWTTHTSVAVTTQPPTSSLTTDRRPTSLNVPGLETRAYRSGSEGQLRPSTSRSPSPSPNGEKVKNITVSKLGSTAQAVLAAMEGRPNSPLLAEDLQHIFDQLPSGMMQVHEYSHHSNKWWDRPYDTCFLSACA